MPSKSNGFPEIRMIMISFDMMPTHDAGVIEMAAYDLGRMKKITKFKNALSRSNAYRVFRSEKQVTIEYLYARAKDDVDVQARLIYELSPPRW